MNKLVILMFSAMAAQSCCAKGPIQSWLPLTVGNRWVYDHTVTSGDMAAQSCCAEGPVQSWLPLTVGNRWVYDHTVTSGDSAAPKVITWTTAEAIDATVIVPEGIVVRRLVSTTEGTPDKSWVSHFGESSYLIRSDCVYLLPDTAYDSQTAQLLPSFHNELLKGQTTPFLCFPLTVGKRWGSPDLGFSWEVVGSGKGNATPTFRVPETAIHVVSRQFTSGDTMHLWIEQGVGIVGQYLVHDGSHFEVNVSLRRFDKH